MHPLRKRRLYGWLTLVVLLCVVVFLVLYAMRQNISLFYTPAEIESGAVPLGARVRVGGMVMRGSVHHAAQGLQVSFQITDFKKQLTVHYRGVLPDLFREGQGVVVSGYLNHHGDIQANEVLAKHDANYMPPAIRDLAQPGRK